MRLSSFTTSKVATISYESNKWYAISSPSHSSVSGQNVADVVNLTDGNYDLLRYNETSGKWEGQKAAAGQVGFTTMEKGRGYIYRRSNKTDVTFYSEPNSGDFNATTTYGCADNAIKGFNLVGNPYNKAYAPTVDFYALNTNGTWAAQTSGTTVAATNAFMIHVDVAGNYAFAEPSGAKSAPVAQSPLAFSVSNDEYSDIAYVRFEKGKALPKLGHLNAEAPVLCIPVEGRNRRLFLVDSR